MNLFQLIIKQMRQRSLSTTLTILSILLGVCLAIAIRIVQRESKALFGQSDFGYDMIIGPPKGSPLQLTLNTVYHMDASPGNIPYSLYADMARKSPPLPGHPDYRAFVRTAVPFMVGDSYQGRRIVGTSPQMFGFDDAGKPVTGDKFEYRKGMSYQLAQGRVFAPRKFEAVIGADIAESLHLHLYDPNKSPRENEAAGGAFRATHGMPAPDQKPDIHKPIWEIVGILKPTHTANDRVLFIPFISLYAIAEHEAGMIDQTLMKANIDPSKIPPDRVEEVLTKLGIDPSRIPESVKRKFKIASAAAPTTAPSGEITEVMKNAALPPAPPAEEEGEDPDAYHLDAKGEIVSDLPPEEWEISAILVKSRGGYQTSQLEYNFKLIDDRAIAVRPALVMGQFFDTFLAGTTYVLLVISALVTVVAAAAIMTTIYNAVSARLREIAILRALGATRVRILALICLEATMIGLIGGIAGLIAGHLLSAVGSVYLQHEMGQSINYLSIDRVEFEYLFIVLVITFLAGLVPALKAYKTPVATNLVAT